MTHHKQHDHSNSHKPAEQAAQSASAPESCEQVPAGSGQGEQAPAATGAAGDTNARLEALAKENADLLARLQRVSADYVNYQKRVQKDIAQTREFANESLLRTLLGVMDDMDRALAEAEAKNDPLVAGMKLVRDKMFQTMQGFGVTALEAQGKPFDPDHHSAVMQEATDAVPPMTIVRELQKGYALKGRTIRPAMVVVSKEVEKPSPQSE